MKKNLLIQLFHKSNVNNISDWYIKSYKELNKKDIKTILIFEEDNNNEINIDTSKYKEDIWLEIKWFLNKNDCYDIINSYKKEYENIEIYTYYEDLISLSSELKRFIWQQTTKNDKLFTSKKLQRELLLKHDKNITVNYIKYSSIEEINKKEILKLFNFPFIIKPSYWKSSSWVIKINSENELNEWIKNLKITLNIINESKKDKDFEIIIEEFIDWQMYTIDYFVDQDQNIFISSLVKTNTLKEEYWIDDFWVCNETLWENINNEINKEKLLDFINKNIKACEIKNTFVHHEFKLTNNWFLKTIELNWRIWWYRTEMYLYANKFNILEYLFNKNIFPINHSYYKFVWLFPKSEKEKLFLWLKDKFIENIKKLKSYNWYMIKESYLWKKIWFTKNWFKYFWTIRLVNKDYNELENDYKYISNNLEESIIYNL